VFVGIARIGLVDEDVVQRSAGMREGLDQGLDQGQDLVV